MSDTYDDADIYYYFDFDYYLRDRRDTHLLDGNLMRRIVDDRIKWMMARKQETARASNTTSSNKN